MSFSSHYVTVCGKEVHYTRWTPSTVAPRADGAQLVVMWHGLNRNGRDFDYMAPKVAESIGLPVVCPDTIGRGLSQWASDPASEYRLSFYHELVNALLDALKVEKCLWVGTSMGGLIGMNLAGRASTSRITALVANDIGPVVPEAAITRIKSYAANPPSFLTVSELEAFLRQAYKSMGPASDAWWRHIAEISARRLPDGSVTTHSDPRLIQVMDLDNADKEGAFWPGWDVYDAITCPLLILHGVESDLLTFETTEAMANRGPKPQILHFEGIGHALSFNNEEQVNTVLKFFKE
jgi:pimeloyl-ACP methyl ester carboxylesterase